jgi:hypothetical protein
VLRTGPEPGQGFWLLGVSGMQQLDGDGPRQGYIGSAPYLAERAGTDGLIKLLTAGENVSGEDHQSVVTLIDGPRRL